MYSWDVGRYYDRRMARDDTVAVVGAGVIGAAVAYALTREGRAVLLLDRAEPGMAGASFGNAGHIASELVEPLPSWGLLFGFWRELFAFGGALDIPLRRTPQFLPWARWHAPPPRCGRQRRSWHPRPRKASTRRLPCRLRRPRSMQSCLPAGRAWCVHPSSQKRSAILERHRSSSPLPFILAERTDFRFRS